MLFSLAALVEQHPSKLVLHSLAGALTKKSTRWNRLNRYHACLTSPLASYSFRKINLPSSQPTLILRVGVLNQCNQLNLLTKKGIQLIMQISAFTCNLLTTMLFSLAALIEQHPSKLVLHSLAGALIKRDFVEPLIISVVPSVMQKKLPRFLNFFLFVAILWMNQ